MKKKDPDFILISDTRVCKSIEQIVREEWGGRCFFNSFSSQARGVAIFMKRNNTATILDKFCDDSGNLLAILINYEGKRILLECIYGPNTDTPDFYSEKAFKKIVDWKPDYSIFAGDFNIALDQVKDTKNYIQNNNPNAREALKNQIDQNNLAKTQKIDLKSFILGNMLTNFLQKYAELRAKLGTKNICGRFGIVLNFCKKAESLKAESI